MVVHRWPSGGTYWRGSSQIGQRSAGAPNWTPQVAQMGSIATDPVTVES
jgi:hypothetical protein